MTVCFGVANRDVALVVADTMLTTSEAPGPVFAQDIEGNIQELVNPEPHGFTSAGEEVAPTTDRAVTYYRESICKVFRVGTAAFGVIAGGEELARRLVQVVRAMAITHPQQFGRDVEARLARNMEGTPDSRCIMLIAHMWQGPGLLVVEVIADDGMAALRVSGTRNAALVTGAWPEQFSTADLSLLAECPSQVPSWPSCHKEKAILCAAQSVAAGIVRRAQGYVARGVGGAFHGALVSKDGWSGFTPRLLEVQLDKGRVRALSKTVHRAPGLWCHDYFRGRTLILPTPDVGKHLVIRNWRVAAPRISERVFGTLEANFMAVTDVSASSLKDELVYLAAPSQPMTLARLAEGGLSISIRDTWREFEIAP